MTQNHNKEVLQSLKAIIDPDLNKDIVSLGFIKKLKTDDSNVSFTLELTTPACPLKENFKTQCKDILMKLDWVKNL